MSQFINPTSSHHAAHTGGHLHAFASETVQAQPAHGLSEVPSDIRSMAAESCLPDCCSTLWGYITYIPNKIYMFFYHIWRDVKVFMSAAHQPAQNPVDRDRRLNELRDFSQVLENGEGNEAPVLDAYNRLSDDTRDLFYGISASEITHDNISDEDFIYEWLDELNRVFQFQDMLRPLQGLDEFSDDEYDIPTPDTPIPSPTVPADATNQAEIDAFKAAGREGRLAALSGKSVAHQIMLMRECDLPTGVVIPAGYYDDLSCAFFADPIRDRCGGVDGGHTFDTEFIMKALSHRNEPRCPITNSPIDVDRIQDGYHPRDPTYGALPKYRVTDYSRVFTHDRALQGQIHTWLKQQLGLN